MTGWLSAVLEPTNRTSFGCFQIRDGTAVAAVAHGAPETLGGGRLAVAGAVIDIVGADDRPGQLLHQVGFFIGALAGCHKAQCVRAVLGP